MRKGEEEKKRDWLERRRFNRRLCFALSRTIWTRLDYSEGDPYNEGIRLYIHWNVLRDNDYVSYHGGMVPSMTVTRMRHTMSVKMSCCYPCRKDVEAVLDYIMIRRPVYPKEEKEHFKRETWYKEFLKEIKEHPFFSLNAFNPFIVHPRENALLYS